MPWCGMVRYPGMQEFRLGTVTTVGFDPDEARRLLNECAGRILPSGFTIGNIERGALIYKPWQQGNGDG